MASSAPEGPASGAALAAPVPSRPKLNPGWGLVVVGGVLGVLGAFLPWARVTYGGLFTHTYHGVSAGRDGKITVVLAVSVLGLTAAAFLGWVRNWQRPVLAILGLIIAFIALADLAASPSVGSAEQARLGLSAKITSSNGIGEWLTLIAGILVVIGVVLVRRYSAPSVSEPTETHAEASPPEPSIEEAHAPD
jgi:hypothetical protein